jgi:hypothetical protein
MKSKAIARWMVLLPFGALAIYLLYRFACSVSFGIYLDTPRVRREIELWPITNGSAQITFKLDRSWDISFHLRTADPEVRTLRVQCRLKNLGQLPVGLEQEEGTMELENQGIVQPNGETIFYDGKISGLLDRPVIRAWRSEKPGRVAVEVRIPSEARLTNAIVVDLDEYKVVL